MFALWLKIKFPVEIEFFCSLEAIRISICQCTVENIFNLFYYANKNNTNSN